MKLPPTFATGKENVNVLIETPRKSRNKFAYDKDTSLFKYTKTLPEGLAFPCDMGFIPNTKGEDGDPLDVLILMEEFTYPGCLIESRIIGVITAEQKEQGSSWIRNDRFIAVPAGMKQKDHIQKMIDINKHKLKEIIDFCEYYNKFENKKFRALEVAEAKSAFKLIKKQSVQ